MSILRGDRLIVGDRAFIPTGRPRAIGVAKPLGKVEEYGPARQVTLVVGQDKGKEPKNRAGTCARKPPSFSPAAVDAEFIRIRAAQVGEKDVGASAVPGRGWYKGRREDSIAYQVAFIPTGSERTFAQFKRNMNRAAELLAERFCQDSVLIVRDSGSRRSVAAATWKPRRPGKK